MEGERLILGEFLKACSNSMFLLLLPASIFLLISRRRRRPPPHHLHHHGRHYCHQTHRHHLQEIVKLFSSSALPQLRARSHRRRAILFSGF